MKTYDPHKPLISLHIPKCAGQSFRKVLEGWFGKRLLFHYFQMHNALPPRYPLQAGICIHGHFNTAKGFGVNAYYPEEDQLITVLRDPLEMHISNYFFWKRTGRDRQLNSGHISPGDEHDYRDINDFFNKRPVSPMLNFLPADITPGTYRTVIAERFVWVGVVEDLEQGVIRLAQALGVKPAAVPRVNVSERTEMLAPELGEKFMKVNSFAFELYRYVAENCERL
jgi:hypothetical protein